MSFELNRLANQLDWNLLRTFMIIVQERSITAAAVRLNVTQPSVSGALRRLEERLDVQLIERGSGRAFHVTSAGERVYREALEIYGGVVRLSDLSRTDAEVLSGNIVIYRSNHLDVSFLSPLLADFCAENASVTFSVTATSCSEVVRALSLRIASLGFCTQLETAPQLRRYALPAQPFGFFCGPAHPLYQCSDPDQLALAESDTVGFDGETLSGALNEIVRYRARHAIGTSMVATTSSIVELINLLRHMPAIGCMAVHHATRHAPDLWKIPLADAGPTVDAHALVDAEQRTTPAERAFLAFLAQRSVLDGA